MGAGPYGRRTGPCHVEHRPERRSGAHLHAPAHALTPRTPTPRAPTPLTPAPDALPPDAPQERAATVDCARPARSTSKTPGTCRIARIRDGSLAASGRWRV